MSFASCRAAAGIDCLLDGCRVLISYQVYDLYLPVREVFKVGILSEEETVKTLEMTDDRNLSTHTYDEEAVEEIYRQVGDYWNLMDKVCRRVVEKTELDFPGRPAKK